MTNSAENNLAALRHSAAHILMQALTRLYPDAVPGVGPAIEDGFYHDFDSQTKITEAELPKIEQEMEKIIKENLTIKKITLPRLKAFNWLKEKKYLYTLELAKELKDKNISFYQQGEFMNMCKGPHLKSTGEVKQVKLLKVAGSYWRGDEKNKMIQRIYGLAFETKEELVKHLEMLAEAEKRDHRKLGKDLKLFMFSEQVGQGLPLWLPKGAMLRKIVHDYTLDKYLASGYEIVSTPHIANIELWKESGHWNFYRDSMYAPFSVPKDNEDENSQEEFYSLKPMNCPTHVKMYNAFPHSYRDLPVRWAEMGTVYRYERSGTLNGLTRVRYFTQDDGHIICTPDQLHKEIDKAYKLTMEIFDTFGFKKFQVNLSKRDPKKKEKYLGRDDQWRNTEMTLAKVLKENNVKYIEDIGEAVFYGPKIDIKVEDVIGRQWQISTIQFDFNLPKQFKMTYIGDDGKEHQPYMVHRALLGSLERFIGVLIEHYAGAFPLWLSPVQIYLVPVSNEKHGKFAQELLTKLQTINIRAEINLNNETVGYKIRTAEKQKMPYTLVIGDKEVKGGNLAIRVRGQKNLINLPQDKFIELIKGKIEKRDLTL